MRKIVTYLLSVLVIVGMFAIISHEIDEEKIIESLKHESNMYEAQNGELSKTISILMKSAEDLNRNYNELTVQYSDLSSQYEKLNILYNELKSDYDSKASGVSRGLETRRSTKDSYTLHATGYIANHDKAPYYGTTKSGVKAIEWYTVAVDTSQFPLGTIFYIPELAKYNGDGIFVAEDTGSAITYGDIDICVPTIEECYSEIGSRKIEVFVIELGTGNVNR